MRTVGIGALGLVGGLLLAIILQDILAPAYTGTEGTPSAVGIVVGSLLPTFGFLGAVLAVWLDRRHCGTQCKDNSDD